MPKETLARIVANRSLERVHEALKPLLIGGGVRAVEEQIGRPQRFFQKTRERDALRMSDYLAACLVLDQDPAALLDRALRQEVDSEIRAPRIITAANKQMETGAEGLGRERLAALEAQVQAVPRSTATTLRQALNRATREEVPELLGLYGSCLRVESKLVRAELVLTKACEMARQLDLRALEQDLLIRMAYVDLELNNPMVALRRAEKATLGYARLNDREGEARGYLTTGSLRFYCREYQEALWDFEATLNRSHDLRQRFSAHVNIGFCRLWLEEEEPARSAADKAHGLAREVDVWMRGKLSWLEAHMTSGEARLVHLRKARDELATRSADALLVTVELIGELLTLEQIQEAEAEVPPL